MENNEVDLLYDAAKVYKEIQEYSIALTVGRKGRSENIVVIFDDSDFHHLVGLHKLTDINQVYKASAKTVLKRILNEEITYATIQNSSFIEAIKDRLLIVSNFNSIFRNPSTVFKFRKVVIQNSRLRWKYLLEFPLEDETPAYLFLDEYRLKPGNHVCVSNFIKGTDYGLQQIKYTMLQIKATHLTTGNTEIWYQNSNYKP